MQCLTALSSWGLRNALNSYCKSLCLCQKAQAWENWYQCKYCVCPSSRMKYRQWALLTVGYSECWGEASVSPEALLELWRRDVGQARLVETAEQPDIPAPSSDSDQVITPALSVRSQPLPVLSLSAGWMAVVLCVPKAAVQWGLAVCHLFFASSTIQQLQAGNQSCSTVVWVTEISLACWNR